VSELVTIITRTNNRPKGFKRVRESIKGQTYPNIKHLVIYDDKRSFKYLKKHRGEDCQTVYIDPERALNEPITDNPNTGKYFPYNLYFNYAHELIEGGFIYYLDDDDELAAPDTIEQLVRVSTNKNVTIGRMDFGGRLVPNDYNFGNDVRLFDIGGSCIFFHSDLIEFATWDCWKCSDFRVSERLANESGGVIWYDHTIMKCNIVGGNGNKNDI
jgi:glycosyltransferase involved in cell wall biosynthesis